MALPEKSMKKEEERAFRRRYQEVRPLAGLRFIGMVLRLVALLSVGAAARLALFLYAVPGKKARHYKEDALLQQARREFVRYRGWKVRTYTWGEGDRKVLLLHGWQSRGTALRYFVPELLSQGFAVVAMDAPAHGESSGYRVALQDYAGSIRAVDQAKGPFEGAITHSFGGRALSYALGFLPHEWKLQRVVMLAVPASLSRIFLEFYGYIGAPPALAEATRAIAERRLGRTVAETEIYNMGALLTLPVLVIHDEEDEIVPLAEAERIAAALPQATLIKTRGLGHFRLAKAPVIWQVAVRFLQGGSVDRISG